MAMQGDCSITVATLPEGSDPDDVIRSGLDLYKYISEAPNWLDWVIDTWAADLDKNDTSMMIAVEKKLIDLINGLRSKALRTHYIDKAARVLSSDNKEAKKIADGWSSGNFTTSSGGWEKRDLNDTRLVVERRLVRNFVHCPESRDALRPLMERMRNPALRWLSMRLQELENFSAIDLTPHSVMAIVAVAEPHYMDQLRPLIRPRVVIENNAGVLKHIEDVIMGEDAPF
jgi:DNA primase